MNNDLFDFWSKMPAGGAAFHPEDTPILDHMHHHFHLHTLPIPFTGPLKTATVVLLYLSPGLNDFDIQNSQRPLDFEFYRRQWTGLASLPTKEEHPPAWNWRTRQLRSLGLEEAAANNDLAILNIGAYHSKDFPDRHLLSALPSCRTSIDWAQKVLFPQAERRERLVVCLRAAGNWGLQKGGEPRGYLLAPDTLRSGLIRRGPKREAVLATIRSHTIH